MVDRTPHALRTALVVGSLLLLPLDQALAQRPAAANVDLEGLAQQLAQLVAEPGFRGFLRSEIAQSKNRENIVELDKFLDRASRRPDVPPGLSQFQQAAKGVSDRLKSDDLEGLDLYIPVDAHRAKWKGGDDVVVAYAPVADEADVREIIAFDVKSGDRVTLDPNREPSRIVLILAPEEHESHEAPKGGPERSPPGGQNPKPHSEGRNPPEKPVEEEPSGGSYIGFVRLKIRDVKEPWWRGDAEIYVKYGQKSGFSCTVSGKWYSQYPMTKINDENVWYSTWSTSRGCISDATCWYFPSTGPDRGWNEVRLDFYERDSGTSRRDKFYQLYKGTVAETTCDFWILDGDDYVDHGYQYRNNFLYGAEYRHDMGNAYVVWKKIP